MRRKWRVASGEWRVASGKRKGIPHFVDCVLNDDFFVVEAEDAGVGRRLADLKFGHYTGTQ
ncbi:MAG: hypothetical protein WBL50_12760, partial [Candidatus Acidiferrum sp.]